MTKQLFLCIFLLVGFQAISQNLPKEMHLSPDGRMLLLGDLPNDGLYDQSLIRRIDLTFSQANYWTLLQSNYNSQTDLAATMEVDGELFDSVGVRFRGQTSYSQTGTSQKKSFNITMDFIHDGQDLMGYETLNLMNCFDDESFIREVFFQHQIKRHIPTAKSAFTKLYLNGSNWGLYPNVQQLNKDFYKEWFMSNDGTNWRADRPPGTGGMGGGWGDGTAGLNYLGSDSTDYNTYYYLKNTEKTDPWSDLINTCDVLNNTTLANLPNDLPTVLDVDRTLWFLACENVFADDDSYIMKGKMDYYVYWEPETGRLTPQEYDGNSVMLSNHVNWSPFYHETNVNYPLMNRMFAVPQWRQRYLAHLRTLITELYDTASANAVINGYKAMIDTIVQNDPKKLYSYSAFQTEVTALKSFIVNRKNYLLSNAEVSQVGPVLSGVAHNVNGNLWAAPVAGQAASVRAYASHANGIYSMTLYYSNSIVGNFTPLPMFDDGLHDDLSSGDGVYGVSIPGQAAGSWVRYYVEAAGGNTAHSVSYDPPGAEHNVYVYIVTPIASSDTSTVINEVMASNTATVMDSAGEYDDWIELYNNSSAQVDISGYYLTDNIVNLDKWTFPSGTVIPANGYLIVWADEDSSQGSFHANFKLSATSESIMLLDPTFALVDSVSWENVTTDLGYARVPNGTGSFIQQQPTYNGDNDLTTSVSDVSLSEISLVVFPNPARTSIRIVANSSFKEVFVYNSMGQTVFESPINGRLDADVSGWSTGVYFVKVGNLTTKFIVQ